MAGTSETGEPDEVRRRKAIQDEFQRLEESALYGAQAQFEECKRWRSFNFSLGLPATLLAAVAGTTGLVESAGRIAAGVLALVSAGLGAVLTTVNASQRMTQAAAAANAYLEIQTAARQAGEIDLPAWTLEEARAALADLTARRNEQNKAADPPSRRSYRKAKANIEAGGQAYAVDEGSNGS